MNDVVRAVAVKERRGAGFRSRPRRGSSRRACVAVLTALAVFVVLQLAAAPVVEWWCPGVIDPDYGSRLRRVHLGADSAHARTVVMLGSSRTFYALHAEALNAPLTEQLGRPVSVVNFGFIGAGPLTELLTWRRLRRDGVRPDLLLVEVLPAFLSRTFPADEMSEARMPADRLRRMDLPLLERYGAGERPTLRRDVTLGECNPLYSRRVGIVNAVAPALLPRRDANDADPVERLAPRPFPALFPPQQRERALERARQEYAFTLENYDLGGRGCAALRELLASCREAGVPAALVLTPEGPAFRDWYPPETWARIEAWLGQVSREYDAPIINAREWIDEDDFVDSHHLLPAGAARFTQRLGRECVLPLLQRRLADAYPAGMGTPRPR